MSEVTYTVECLFGHATCESYFVMRGDKMIGMGRSRWYDKDGNLTREVNEPTGLVADWPEETTGMLRRLVNWLL